MVLSRLSFHFSVIVCALAVFPANPGALGADPPTKVLTVSRSPAPMPALGHRLLPLESELTPGDAAPIYLRLTSEISREKLRDLGEKTQAWLALPLDQFPVDSARVLVDLWRPQLKQIEFGARRRSCEWNYSIPEETEHIIEISLAEAQVMRIWARLVALKARLEIADNNLPKAARTIEEGLSFSRQVGDGPFLINMLVGVRAALEMLDRVDDLVGQPGAPNLYWSLTALPRPLIAARRAVANEYKMCEWMLPEMTDLDQTRTGEEWGARLKRFHSRMLKLAASYAGEKSDRRFEKLDDFRKWVLPEALKYLRGRLGTWNSMHEDQAILMYFGGNYRDLYDEVYKASYLPFPRAEEFYRHGHERLYAVKQGPLDLFARLIANIEAGHRSEAMLDRKVAALRVVEALRLHAGIAGELPKSLDDVKIVPIPADPVSGKSFEYSVTGDMATIEGAMPKGALGLTYRITLRK
jgi:hypothetical protein